MVDWAHLQKDRGLRVGQGFFAANASGDPKAIASALSAGASPDTKDNAP